MKHASCKFAHMTKLHTFNHKHTKIINHFLHSKTKDVAKLSIIFLNRCLHVLHTWAQVMMTVELQVIQSHITLTTDISPSPWITSSTFCMRVISLPSSLDLYDGESKQFLMDLRPWTKWDSCEYKQQELSEQKVFILFLYNIL